MELKPSQVDLDEIAAVKLGYSGAIGKLMMRRAEVLRHVENASSLSNFEQKLVSIDRRKPFGQKSEYHKETAWIDIANDEDTGLTLQAMTSYELRPTAWSTYNDFMNSIKPITEYSIFIRSTDNRGDEPISSRGRLAAGLRIKYSGERSIFMEAELGMKPGEVFLTGEREVDPRMVEQALELERKLIDPLIAALSTQVSR